MVSVILFLSLFGYVLTRGPHHPRNAQVTKHHVHYRPTRGVGQNEKITSDAALLHDTEHIQEDLGAWVSDKDISEMTDEELEFHYFQLHDFDKNNRLDGLEILQAIHHTENHEHDLDHDQAAEPEDEETKEANFEYYVELIDRVLADDDTDNDGFLSYAEYAAGRKRENERKAKELEEEERKFVEIEAGEHMDD